MSKEGKAPSIISYDELQYIKREFLNKHHASSEDLERYRIEANSLLNDRSSSIHDSVWEQMELIEAISVIEDGSMTQDLIEYCNDFPSPCLKIFEHHFIEYPKFLQSIVTMEQKHCQFFEEMLTKHSPPEFSGYGENEKYNPIIEINGIKRRSGTVSNPQFIEHARLATLILSRQTQLEHVLFVISIIDYGIEYLFDNSLRPWVHKEQDLESTLLSWKFSATEMYVKKGIKDLANNSEFVEVSEYLLSLFERIATSNMYPSSKSALANLILFELRFTMKMDEITDHAVSILTKQLMPGRINEGVGEGENSYDISWRRNVCKALRQLGVDYDVDHFLG